MLESLVRPFQSGNPFATQRFVIATSKKQVPQKATLTWGAAGTLPTAIEDTTADGGVSIKVDSTALNTEVYRITDQVRIENPDDSSQFVMVKRISKIGFSKPKGTSASTSTVDKTTGATTTTTVAGEPTTNDYALKNP